MLLDPRLMFLWNKCTEQVALRPHDVFATVEVLKTLRIGHIEYLLSKIDKQSVGNLEIVDSLKNVAHVARQFVLFACKSVSFQQPTTIGWCAVLCPK